MDQTESNLLTAFAADDLSGCGERFRALVQNGAHAVSIVDDTARISYVSPSMAGLSGYSPEELIGRIGFDFVAADSLQMATDHFARVVTAPGQTETFEVEAIHKDGRLLWLEVALVNMLDHPDVRGVVAYLHEVTQRKVDQERLRETEEKYRRLVEDVPAIVYVSELGEEGPWHYVSPQVESMLGISNEEWMDNPSAWLEAIHPDDRPRVMEEEASAHQMGIGDTIASEYRVVPRSGNEIWVRDEYRLLTSPQDPPCLVRGVITDISARKHLEEQLRQSQKMDAIGQLAGGIAHDFNNLLLIVQNSARFIAEDLDDADPKKEDANEIIKAGERAGALIRQLLTFSRKEVVSHENIRVNEIVTDIERLLRRTIGENIHMELLLDPDAGHITIDRSQLEQVIVNLAVNAKDAMPGGGRLQIKTMVVESSELGTRHPGVGSGRYLGLSVVDTGEGMTPDVRDRAFEPFFTTKARGEGTGLGLATVFGVVQGAGGFLEIESSPGFGTSVTAFFPRKANGCPPDRDSKMVEDDRRGGGQTILVVEDEEAVRRLVQRILDRNGYEVLVAESGDAALDVVGQHAPDLDLVLTDVVMPHMSGKELATRLNDAGYKFPILFMSGYTDHILSRDGQLSGDEDLIQKPFDSASLLAKIAATLNGH